MSATRVSVHNVVEIQTSTKQFTGTTMNDAFELRVITVIDSDGHETQIELFSTTENGLKIKES